MSERPFYRLHGVTWCVLTCSFTAFCLVNFYYQLADVVGDLIAPDRSWSWSSAGSGWPFSLHSSAPGWLNWMALNWAIAAYATIGAVVWAERRARGNRLTIPRLRIHSFLAAMATIAFWLWVQDVGGDGSAWLVEAQRVFFFIVQDFGDAVCYCLIFLATVGFLESIGNLRLQKSPRPSSSGD